MGREGYSREAYEAAAQEMAGADAQLEGKKEGIQQETEQRNPQDTAHLPMAERAKIDFKEAASDVKSAVDLVGSWARVRMAERKLVSLHETAQGEAMELNAEHDRLKQEATEALQRLEDFEKEKLGVED